MFALGNRRGFGRKHQKSSGDRRRHGEVRTAYQSRLGFEPLEDRRLLSVATLADLPVAAQHAISSAIGQDQSVYYAASGAAGVTLANPANGFTAQVQAGALHIAAGSDTWDMSLAGLGYGGAVQPVGTAQTSVHGNRVDSNYTTIDEWCINGPGGLEQGFTVAPLPQPDATGSLTVELALGGDLTGTVNAAGDGLTLSRPDGSTALGYTGLVAYDATGKALPASLEIQCEGGRQDLLIHVNDAGAQGQITIDPFVQQAKLTASGGAAGDYFGNSVSVSGTTVVVGSPGTTVGSNSGQGAAYVFTESGSNWSQTATLTASDGAAGDGFGYSVSISGTTVVVGAPYATVGDNGGQGAAYVFTEPGSGGWASTSTAAKLTASDGAAYDDFGDSVSISGDGTTVVVGANQSDSGGRGAAYVFTEPGSGGWASTSTAAELTASDGVAYDDFGGSVSINGDGTTVVVGANQSDSGGSGAAYVFTEPGSGGWAGTNTAAELTASDGAGGDDFGYSVSINGDGTTVVVGADQSGSGGNGVAYVFTKSGSVWSQTAELTASDGAAYDGFGSSVSISGATVVVGAPYATVDNSGQGAAYVFTKPGSGGWANTSTAAKLTASDGVAGDYFGGSVSISGNTVMIGAWDATIGGNSGQGAAYLFTGSGSAWSQTAKFTESGNTAGDEFGYSVSISGIMMVVGAPHVTVGGNASQGAAYVFTESGSVWSQTAELTASDGAAGDEFGTSVSINESGATVVVGADRSGSGGQGAAYVFTEPGSGGWASTTETAELTASDGVVGDDFGVSVSISGNTVVVGADGATVNGQSYQGAAYVFTESGSVWSQTAELTASNGAAADIFGTSVSISGNTVVVGSPYVTVNANPNQGAAYVFTEPVGGWKDNTETAELTASDGEPDDGFGASVSISGNTVLVGAPGATVGSNLGQGAAYVFTEPGSGSWASTSTAAKLTASGGLGGDYFGASVSISGNTVVVGAEGVNSFQGAAYVFTEPNSGWVSTSTAAKLTASDGASADDFGTSVSISGNTVVVGAYLATVNGNPSQGAAYVFTEPGPVWSQAKLTASDGESGDGFGYSVSISGNTVVVGAPYATVGGIASPGAAYVFTESGSGSWTSTSLAANLTASGGDSGDDFGCSVSISGDGTTVVVGADQSDSGGTGVAYVFTKSGSVWSQTAELTASGGAAGDDFGSSVSINESGNTVVVGADQSDSDPSGNGAAYVFTKSGSVWSQTAELTASGGAAGDGFGDSVSISGDGATVVVGADQSVSGGNGAAYVFTKSGSVWSPTATLTASDGAAYDDFGCSVVINGDGNTVVVGADQFDSGGNGAAYVFTKPGSGGWASTSTATELIASGGAAYDDFGYSVSINGTGDRVVVGADQSGSGGNGAAYVFTEPAAGGWASFVVVSTNLKLTASDGAAYDDFGCSVSINGDGDTVVVGADQFDSGGNGAAYVFATSTAPMVTANPTNATTDAGLTTAVTFTAAATGTPTPAVKWQVNTGSGVFTDLPNGGVYSGVTTTTLTVTGATLGMSGYQYQAVFTNGTAPDATTTAATLTVNAALGIAPTALPGGVVNTLYHQTINVSGGTTPYTTFTVSGFSAGGTGLTSSEITADGSAGTIVISGTPTGSGSASFTVNVTDTVGAALIKNYTIGVSQAPAVTTNPTSATTDAGLTTTVTFTAAATGIPTPAVKWQVSSGSAFTDLSNSSVYSGVTTTTLTVTGATLAMNDYQYRAVFANGTAPDATTTAATLTVNAALGIAPTALPGGVANTLYHQTINVSGGTTPYTTFTVSGFSAGGTGLTSSEITADGSAGTIVISGTPTGAGSVSFTVNVTDTVAAVLSKNYTIAVGVPPAVTTNPTSATTDAGLATAVTFTAAATGIPTPTVKWQENSGSGFTDLSNGGVYSGVTIPTLTVSGATRAMNGYQYRAVFTNGTGPDATTTAATLTVNLALGIVPTALPGGILNTLYNQTITVSGGTTPYTTFTVSGFNAGGTGLTSSEITADGSAGTIVINGTPTGVGSAFFTVNVTDTVGATFSKDYTIAVGLPPTVTTNPTSARTDVGLPTTAVTFTAAATGIPTPTVKWQVSSGSGFTDLSNGGVYSGVTTSTLTVTGATRAMNGYLYRAVFTNGAAPDATTTAATLTVNPALGIAPTALPGGIVNTPYHQTITVSGGTTPYTTFTVSGFSAGGTGLTNSEITADGSVGTVIIDGTPTGAGSASFTVTVTDTVGVTLSQNYTIGVSQPPAVTTNPSNARTDVGLPMVVTFTAAASGSPMPTVKWQVSSGSAFTDLSNGGFYSGVTTSTLTVTGATLAVNGYQYRAVFTNGTAPDATTTAATLTVNPALGIAPTKLPGGVVNTLYHQTITVSGGTTPYTTFTVSGFSAGGTGLTSGDITVNGSAGTIVVNGTPTGVGSASFTVNVTDTVGATLSKNYTIGVSQPPAVTTNPSNARTDAGLTTAVTFTAAATGSPTPTVKWQVNSGSAFTDLSNGGFYSGVTTTTLTVSSATLAMNGYQYRAVFTNGTAPDATTTAATLTVNPALGIAPTKLPGGVANSLYHQTITVSGGTTPYTTFTVSGFSAGGTGLTRSEITVNGSAGTIVVNGTPTGAGSASFTVNVTDTVGATLKKDYTIGVGQPPAVTGISPTAGPLRGGTSVTITGTNLAGATAVKFGGTAVTTFTSDTDGAIVLDSPAGGAGVVDVTVVAPGGTSAESSADRFTYVAAPSVAGINPSQGAAAGGTTVTITGSNLTGATAVMFGTVKANTFTFDAATNAIIATSPPGTAGTVDVTVVARGGASAVNHSADQFTYAPVVTGISLSKGPATGGTTVTITGFNLTNATAVKFGAVAAGIESNTVTQIVAVSPPGTVGTVHVTVVTSGGTSIVSTADQFSYVATPTITWANPADITYGTALGATQLDATASVAGTFSYTPAAGKVLTAGSHTLSVDFAPTDTAHYNAPATKTVTIVVDKATPTITWANPADITYGTALSSGRLDAASSWTVGGVSGSVAGTFSYTPAAGKVLTAGSHTLSVTFAPTDTADYNTAATKTATIVVDKATPTITWANPADITYGTALGATQLDATANVAGAFAYTPTTGTVLTAGDNQTLSVTFTPTDTVDYTAATKTATIVVDKATPTITWANPADITYGTALGATQLDATANVAGAFAYTPTTGTVLTAGNSQTLSVTFTPTDTTDYATASNGVSINVRQAAPTVTGISPTAGPLAGGTSVTITGTNLKGATAVKFGTKEVTTFFSDTATQIVLNSPAGSVSTVDVTVVTPIGASATSSADQFSYVAAMSPEIAVQDGTTPITSGQTTPIDVGSAVHNATGPVKTFTIRNVGDHTLTLTSPSSSSFANTAHFIVGPPGDTTLTAGQSTSFTVTLNTDAVWDGKDPEQISFLNTDANNGDGIESPFTFMVSGTVTPLPPKIDVFDGSNAIANGQTTPIDVGNGVRNLAGPKVTFTIQNDGDQTLILTPSSFADTAHFTVSKPGDTTLTANESTTFTVTLKTNAVWSEGTENISFAGNDTNNNSARSFSFPVSGSVRDLLHGASTLGLYNPATFAFYLRNSISLLGPTDKGYADDVFSYSTAQAGWLPIAGDWNGDGVDTVGLYNPTTSTFYLWNAIPSQGLNNPSTADAIVTFGQTGWLPVVGDWNGDGKDTVGLYDPATSTFYLRNTNNSGNADVTFVYGAAGAGWLPIAGDWDGNRRDTLGLYDPTRSVFMLRNTTSLQGPNDMGYADVTFLYGQANAGWLPLAGDWNGDGTDTIGVYDPTRSLFMLRNTTSLQGPNDHGYADATFFYGQANAGWLPIIGNWAGPAQALMAAGGPVTAAADTPALNQTNLQPIVNEAIARWTSAGLDAATVAKLTQVQFVISDLPGSYLGETEGNQIYIDTNAAGYGWFVDPTPAADEEFTPTPIANQLQAIDPRAVDHIDLLTVVEHELGHVAGYGDLDALADNLMSGVLGVGIRRNPG